MTHEHWMRHACDLALRGTGYVSPNPRVGAVIVRHNKIVAEGWHAVYGGLHAEAHALQSFDGITDGAAMYVTLEPCAHVGKQPPCTNAIIASGIQTVVIGMRDPNPSVIGGGAELLRSNGVTVVENVCADESAWINRFFTTWTTQHRPYVIAKIAMTEDGSASASTHEGRWITNSESRRRVHALRAEVDCVVTGVGTVRADDPLLNVRVNKGRNPLRVIIDTHCTTPIDSSIARTAQDIPTLILCSASACNTAAANTLRSLGCEVSACTLENDKLRLADVMRILTERGCTSILIEAGPTLTKSCIDGGYIDELEVHIGTGMGNVYPRWPDACVAIHPDTFTLHHEHMCHGDHHRIYTRVRS